MSEPATLEFISDNISEDKVIFPGGDILSDEPPLESDLHREQIDLLIRILKLWWRDRSARFLCFWQFDDLLQS